MASLDARAARAADAIRTSVNAVPPVPDIVRVHRRRLIEHAAMWTGGMSVVVALVVAAAWLRPGPAPEVADTPTTMPMVTSSIPAVPQTTMPDTSTSIPRPTTDLTSPPSPPAVISPPPAFDVDTTPPLLEILSPADETTLTDRVVRFEGVTEPGAVVAAGKWVADVAADGSWSIVLVLSPGKNVAAFTARDEAGNRSTASITLHYEPAPATTSTTEPLPASTTTTTTPEEPPAAEFAAHQVYGECAEPIPFDVFYGTALPGEKVRVISDFGSETTYAGPEGHWEVRVEFPDAPFGDSFVVHVKDERGHVVEFTFVRIEA